MNSTGSKIKLHERQRELAVIEDLLDRLAAGEGGVALIEGPLGIGKTTLLREAARRAGGRRGGGVSGSSTQPGARTSGTSPPGSFGSCSSPPSDRPRSMPRSSTPA